MEETDRLGNLPPRGNAILALLERIGDGDGAAVAELYDRTGPLVFGLALGILGTRAQAEEAVLDIYTHIWKNAAAYDPAVPPLEWLIATTRERALLGPRRGKPMTAAPGLRPGGKIAATVAPAEQERARAAVKALPDAQREILTWAYGSALSCDEIAARLGKPVGAVKTHVRLGLSRLAETAQTAQTLQASQEEELEA